jgi:Outer membrane efflux protein
MPHHAPDSATIPSATRRELTGVLLAALTGCAASGDVTEGPERGIALRSGFHAGQRPGALGFTWPNGIPAGQPLTEDQAVAVALWNNPDFQSALAGLGVARADVIKAGQLSNPALGLLFPANGIALEATASLPLEALWLRPLRVKAAQIEAQAVADHLTQGGLNVIRDVRVACAGIELARQRRRFAEESAGSFEGIAGVAEARLKSGETGELESAQARAEAHVSQQEAQRLAYEEKLAMESLRSLLGLSSSAMPLTLRPLPAAHPGAPRSAAALVREALASRPDVRAAELAVVAAGVRARLAKAEILNLAAAGKLRGASSGPARADQCSHEGQRPGTAGLAMVCGALRSSGRRVGLRTNRAPDVHSPPRQYPPCRRQRSYSRSWPGRRNKCCQQRRQ